MAPAWLVSLWILALSLATACGVPPEIVFLNPPKAPLGTKIRVEGRGFTGTTEVTFLDRRWFRTLPATFSVISDQVLEVTMPASPAPYPFFEKLGLLVKSASGVTVTIPPDAPRLTGSSLPAGGSLCVVTSGASIPSWQSGSCIVFVEPGATIGGAGGGGNIFLVSPQATMELAYPDPNVYAAAGANITGEAATSVPAVTASYVPALLEIGTPPPSYTINKNVTGDGSVTVSPQQTVYYSGQTVQLTAVPNPGSAFSQWSGPVSGKNRKTSFVINENVTVGAAFVPGANFSASAQQGTVQISPLMDVYPLGTTINVTYLPSQGYEFERWSGDISSTTNPLSFVIEQTTDIVAEPKTPQFGKLLWSFGQFIPTDPFMGDDAVWSTPAIGDDGTIYIGYFVRGPRTSRDAKLFAIYPDGTQRWVKPLSLQSDNPWGVSYPVIGNDGTIYAAVGPLLSAFSPNGDALWTKSFGSQSDGGARIAAPAIGTDGTLYIARMDGVLFAMSPNQQIRWQHEDLGALSFPPSIAADGSILVGPSIGAIRAFNPDGTLRWTSIGKDAGTSLALSSTGEIVYGNGGLYSRQVMRMNSDGTPKRADSAFPLSSEIVLGRTGGPFFSATDGSIVSLTASGAVSWTHQPHPAMPATTPILGDDGKVYFASSAGDTHRFIAYNPDGSIMWENGALAQNAGDSNVWTSLALDRNGVLYGGSRSGKFYAVQATGRLATGDWPKPGADYGNTNRQPSPGPATAPVITLVPQSTDVVAGQTLTLSARASGTPEPSYQWFASGAAIAGATSPTLAIRNVQLSHAGEYFVRISNSVGSTESLPVNVKVLLTLGAEATAGGSVTVEPAQTTYDVGSSATITATAADGYEFTGWTGDAEGTQNPLIVTLNANKTVTANFVRTYVLTLNPVGSGSIAATPQQARYRSDQSVTVTAVPDDGYGFSGWTGALAGEAPMGTVLMDADKSVTATFVPLRTLNAQAQPGGSVTVAPNQTTFLNGAQVTLTAAREPGYDFKGWTGDIESQANPLVVTLDRNVSVLATFGPAQPPAVSFDVPANSSVSDRRFSLTGAISDNNAIASATWEREGESMGDLTLVDGKFAVPALTLVEGVNRFRIITTDSVGNETVADYVITWTPSQVLEVAVPAEETEGRLITVPIRLTSTGDVSGTAFTLSFDPAYFRTEDFYFVPEFTSPFNQVNRSTPGRIRASLAYVGTLPPGTVEIGYAVVRVRSVPEDLDARLELSEVSTASFLGDSLNDSTAIHSGVMRLLKRAHVGDINANGRLDVGDASLIQRLVTEIELPRAWDIPANDLNGNTALDVGDVQRALSTAAGIFPQPGTVQQGANILSRRGATAAAVTPESIRLVAERRTASAGEQWVVRVVVDHLSGPLAGASFTLDYPTAALRLVDSSSHGVGALLPSNSFATVWNVAPARNNYAAQTGRVSMAASSAATNSATDGVLAEFTFQVQPGAAAQSSWPLTLRNSDLTSDGFLVRSLPAAELVFNGWAVRYADWQHAAFQDAPGGNGGDSAPDADPDRDGITNRMEYQFGSDPLGADAGGAVRSSIEAEDGEHFLTITYTRRRDAADTKARVEVSTDLETWLYNEDGTGKTYTVETSASDNGDGTEDVVVRVLNATELGARTFVRVNFVEN